MQIIVKTFFGGREIPCTVEAWDTVDHVKAVVQDNAGIPTDEQQLFWGGLSLDGSRTLADYAFTWASVRGAGRILHRQQMAVMCGPGLEARQRQWAWCRELALQTWNGCRCAPS